MLELGVGIDEIGIFDVSTAGDDAGAALFWKNPVMVLCLLLLDWGSEGLGRGVAISLPSIPLTIFKCR